MILPVDSATILLVDDDDGVRRILRKVLEAKPYRVVENGQPRNACAIFDADPMAIDLVVTDLKMPGMSGQDVAAHIWSTRPDLRILFISGYTDQTYAEALNGPRSRFLEKPFASEALLQHVAELLGEVV
jgi:two-component system, cell cycle sensor histidine kinase and response regulator CckA